MNLCESVTTANSVVRSELRLGRCIKVARRQKGITQELLSQLMTERGFQGFRQQRICAIEKRGRVYGLELVNVAEILGMSVEKLMQSQEQDLIYNVGDVLVCQDGEPEIWYMIVEEKPEEGYLDVLRCEVSRIGDVNEIVVCQFTALDLRESERYEKNRSPFAKHQIFAAFAKVIEQEQSGVLGMRATLSRLMAIAGNVSHE